MHVIMNPPEADFGDQTRTWQGIPSISLSQGGRLFVAWYSGGPVEGSDLNYSLLAYSDDKGRTWSKPTLVIQGEPKVRVGEPVPWVDPSNKLWLFWNEDNPDKTKRGTWAIRCDHPDAPPNDWKWTEPQFIGSGILLAKPLVVRDGTWLLPLDVRYGSELATRIGKNMAGVLVSRNQGESWEWVGGWSIPEDIHDFDEHCIVQLGDGSLLAVIRTKIGAYQSSSTDAGKTWTTPTMLMPGVRSRIHLQNLPSGRLLLIFHDGLGKPGKDRSGKEAILYSREKMTAFLSEDGGKTWFRKLLLDPRDKVSYPDAAIGPDGMIYGTWDYARYITGAKEVVVQSFTEEDLLQGREPAPPVVVNRATGYGNEIELKNAEEDKMRDRVNEGLLRGSSTPARP